MPPSDPGLSAQQSGSPVKAPLLIPAASSGRFGIVIILGIFALIALSVAGYWFLSRKSPMQEAGGAETGPAPVTAALKERAPPPRLPQRPALNEIETARELPAPVRIATPAVAFDPPPLAGDEWDHALELLPTVVPQRDGVAGDWRFEGQTLVDRSRQYSRLMVPYEVGAEYDLRFDFTRRSGELDKLLNAAAIQLIISHKSRNLVLHIDEFSNGYYSDFKKLKDHPLALPAPLLTNGKRCTCVIKVRQQSLTAYLDGREIRAMDLTQVTPELTPDWRLPNQLCIGMGSNVGEVAYHRVAYRAITGEGQPVPVDTDFEKIMLEQHWEDAIDLLGAPAETAFVVHGKWTFPDNSAHVEKEPQGSPEHPRLQFNFLPPEEYDYRIEYTRQDGFFDVAQILSANKRSFAWKIAVNGMSLLDQIGTLKVPVIDNAFALRTPQINRNGQRHVSVVCVRKNYVRCYVDGQLLTYLRTNYSNLNLQQNLALRVPNTLGVTVCECSATFHKAQLKEVSGKAVKIRGDGKETTAAEF